MDQDERTDEQRWIDDAIQTCVNAKEKSILVAMIRRQDAHDQADILVTNAANPDQIAAVGSVINGPGGGGCEANDD